LALLRIYHQVQGAIAVPLVRIREHIATPTGLLLLLAERQGSDAFGQQHPLPYAQGALSGFGHHEKTPGANPVAHISCVLEQRILRDCPIFTGGHIIPP